MTIEELQEYIEEEDVKFIRLAFRDAYGVQKNISIMSSEIVKTYESGTPINAREIAGFEDCPFAVLYLRPNIDTMAILPWRPDSGRVIRMFCDIYTPDGEEYVSEFLIISSKPPNSHSTDDDNIKSDLVFILNNFSVIKNRQKYEEHKNCEDNRHPEKIFYFLGTDISLSVYTAYAGSSKCIYTFDFYDFRLFGQ